MDDNMKIVSVLLFCVTAMTASFVIPMAKAHSDCQDAQIQWAKHLSASNAAQNNTYYDQAVAVCSASTRLGNAAESILRKMDPTK